MRYFGHGQLFSGVLSVTIDLSLDGYLVASILNNIDHTLTKWKENPVKNVSRIKHICYSIVPFEGRK